MAPNRGVGAESVAESRSRGRDARKVAETLASVGREGTPDSAYTGIKL